MHHIIGYFALLGIVFGIPDGPEATPAVASVNPYAAVRNPLGYRSYHNPASATAPILTYSNTHGIDGSYSYSFSTGDGKQAQENGFLKDAHVDNNGEPQGTQVKEGSYSYVSPEGIPIQLEYVADENGFKHGGVHFSSTGNLADPFLGNNKNQIYDPRFNYNNPYNYRNPAIGPYNPTKPFDPRYNYNPYNHPYNHRYNPYPYNPYRPASFNNAVKPQAIEKPL